MTKTKDKLKSFASPYLRMEAIGGRNNYLKIGKIGKIDNYNRGLEDSGDEKIEIAGLLLFVKFSEFLEKCKCPMIFVVKLFV